MAELEGIWPISDQWTEQQLSRDYMDTFRFPWNLAFVKETELKGKCKWITTDSLIQTKWNKLQVWKHC